MSESESGKSMDDVLASIRRIVRAEKQPAAEYDDEAESEDVPLALTPDMRLEGGEAVEGATAAEFIHAPPPAVEEDLEAPEPAVEASALFAAAPADVAVSPDLVREMLREELQAGNGAELVREILREELEDGNVTDLVRNVLRGELEDGKGADLVRGIIREELTTGEIGSNISRNVLRLVRAEVAKAGES